MERLSTRSRLRAFMLVGALGATLALPIAANADTAPGSTGVTSVTIAPDATILGKVVATLDVSFTCDPFTVYDYGTGQYVQSTQGSLEYANATLTQASGRTIASGSESVIPDGPLVCDGLTSNHATSTITATTLPWKKGTAVATVRIFIASTDFQSSDQGQAGPLVVKLAAK